jgi:hypothetical protein
MAPTCPNAPSVAGNWRAVETDLESSSIVVMSLKRCNERTFDVSIPCDFAGFREGWITLVSR